jgi:hypothetical protein
MSASRQSRRNIPLRQTVFQTLFLHAADIMAHSSWRLRFVIKENKIIMTKSSMLTALDNP